MKPAISRISSQGIQNAVGKANACGSRMPNGEGVNSEHYLEVKRWEIAGSATGESRSVGKKKDRKLAVSPETQSLHGGQGMRMEHHHPIGQEQLRDNLAVLNTAILEGRKTMEDHQSFLNGSVFNGGAAEPSLAQGECLETAKIAAEPLAPAEDGPSAHDRYMWKLCSWK